MTLQGPGMEQTDIIKEAKRRFKEARHFFPEKLTAQDVGCVLDQMFQRIWKERMWVSKMEATTYTRPCPGLSEAQKAELAQSCLEELSEWDMAEDQKRGVGSDKQCLSPDTPRGLVPEEGLAEHSFSKLVTPEVPDVDRASPGDYLPAQILAETPELLMEPGAQDSHPRDCGEGYVMHSGEKAIEARLGGKDKIPQPTTDNQNLYPDTPGELLQKVLVKHRAQEGYVMDCGEGKELVLSYREPGLTQQECQGHQESARGTKSQTGAASLPALAKEPWVQCEPQGAEGVVLPPQRQCVPQGAEGVVLPPQRQCEPQGAEGVVLPPQWQCVSQGAEGVVLPPQQQCVPQGAEGAVLPSQWQCVPQGAEGVALSLQRQLILTRGDTNLPDGADGTMVSVPDLPGCWTACPDPQLPSLGQPGEGVSTNSPPQLTPNVAPGLTEEMLTPTDPHLSLATEPEYVPSTPAEELTAGQSAVGLCPPFVPCTEQDVLQVIPAEELASGQSAAGLCPSSPLSVLPHHHSKISRCLVRLPPKGEMCDEVALATLSWRGLIASLLPCDYGPGTYCPLKTVFGHTRVYVTHSGPLNTVG